MSSAPSSGIGNLGRRHAVERQSRRVEEYLRTTWEIGRREPATVTKLARRLGVRVASVSQMVTRLVEEGLVKRGPTGAITLTPSGEAEVARVIRRHRLSERFLMDYLGVPLEDVYREACLLEYGFSPETEARLAARLGEPSTCPHGWPIPDASGDLPDAPMRRLSELGSGESAVVACVAEDDSGLLRQFAGVGLLPDVTVMVEGTTVPEGRLLVRIGEAHHAVGVDVAEKVFLRV